MVDIARTFGALMIGCIVAAVFSGIVTAQTFAYFKNYAKDKRSMKVMVGTVWILDFWHTIFVSASLWDHLIAHFGDETRIDYIPWSLALTIAFTAILTFIVHLFFVYRIYRLSQRNLFIAAPLFLIACARLCFACLTTATMITLKSLQRFIELYMWSFTCGLTLSSALDIFIMALMIFLLRSRQNTNSAMNHVLDRLVLYTFETGSLTCAVAVVSLICWLANKKNLVFMGLHFIISKTYANSLLATLNTRRHLREGSSSRSRSRRKTTKKTRVSGSGDKNVNLEDGENAREVDGSRVGENGRRQNRRRRSDDEGSSGSESEDDSGLNLFLANVPGLLTSVRGSIGRMRDSVSFGAGRVRERESGVSFGAGVKDTVSFSVGAAGVKRTWRSSGRERERERERERGGRDMDTVSFGLRGSRVGGGDVVSFGVGTQRCDEGVAEESMHTRSQTSQMQAHTQTQSQTFQLQSIVERVGQTSSASTEESGFVEHEGAKAVLAKADKGERDGKVKPLEAQRSEPAEEDISLALKGATDVSGTANLKKGEEER